MRESFVLQIVIRVSAFLSVLGWVWGPPVLGKDVVRIRMEVAGSGGDRLSSRAQGNTSSEVWEVA